MARPALRTDLGERCRRVFGRRAGDFNVAPEDLDVWDPAEFVGSTHVSEPERAALRDVEGWGLDDVFRRFNDAGTFTWWDYRAGDFHQGRGMRIDLVLVSDDLVQRATGAFRGIATPARVRSRQITLPSWWISPTPEAERDRAPSAQWMGAWPSPRAAEPLGQAPDRVRWSSSVPGPRQERQSR